MFSIITFFVIIIVTSIFAIRAKGDEVREARVMRAFFTSLTLATMVMTIVALVAGAPATVVTVAGATTLFGWWFAHHANKAYVEAVDAASIEAEFQSSISEGLRREIAAGTFNSESLRSVMYTDLRSVTTELGRYTYKGAKYVIGYEGRPAFVTDEGEEIFAPSQLRRARLWE